MTSGLSDIRFEGYSNDQLAAEVDGLRSGAGSESLHRAVDALVSIANALAETDQTLRTELAKIGVEWQGEASEKGHEETQKASIYAEEAVPVVEKSADGVNQQGETFSHSRNSAPNSDALRGPTDLNGWDRFAGAFGHTTDNAQRVQETEASRGQAIGSLNDYQKGSQSALDSHQNLPVPPGMGLVAQPTDPHGMTSAQGFHGTQGSYTPTGGPGAGAPGSAGPFGGGSGQPGYGGAPGQPGYTGIAPPGGGGPNSPLPGPGRIAGIGPVSPLPGGLPFTGTPGLSVRAIPIAGIIDASAIAGIAGATGGGAAAGASARGDRVVRGGAGAPVDGPDPKADAKARGAAAVSSVPPEQAKAARAAERLGGGGGRSGSSMMSPAAGKARGEEDDEHVRKYGIDSDDVFGDGRLVIDAVLGGEDDEKR